MANNKTISNYFYNFFNHIKKNKATIIWAAIFCLIGIVFGIALLFGEKSYLNLLSTKNQNMLGYITGSVSVFQLFWRRLFSGIFAYIIIFTCCLNFYSSFICFLYFAYQSAVCTLMCGTLISYQGFSAILNTIFLIVPSNLLLFSVLIIAFSVFFSRAKNQIKHKQNFVNSFGLDNFWQHSLLPLVALIALNIIVSLIVPLIIKGICLIYY